MGTQDPFTSTGSLTGSITSSSNNIGYVSNPLINSLGLSNYYRVPNYYNVPQGPYTPGTHIVNALSNSSGQIEADIVFSSLEEFELFKEHLSFTDGSTSLVNSLQEGLLSDLIELVNEKITLIKEEISKCDRELSVHRIYLEGQVLGLQSTRDLLSKKKGS